MTAVRNVLAYCEDLFTRSESFIPRAYSAFTRLKPIYIGHNVKGPIPANAEVIELGPLHGFLGETGFKQLGAISRRLKDTLVALDAVAIHASFGKSGTYALPLAHKLNLPLAVTYYGGDATKTINTKNSFVRVYNRRRAELWRDADLLLAVSGFIRRELLTKGAPDEKLVVHHNAADAAKFKPGHKRDLIVFAGRWTEKKGIDTLIEALSKLKSELEGWSVRLIGDGDLKPRLVAQLKAAGVEAELPGWVDSDDMPKHWAEARIACVPSKRAASGNAEGMPLTCIEAMLAGCALAATNHAGIPDCVKNGETGFLVEEDDSEALADCLAKLLSDRAATTKMGQAGRAFAIESFNLHTQSVKLEDHLLRIAGLH